jgi:hypothetical protein
MIGCGILHKEDDWDIYRLPNGRLTLRHYHESVVGGMAVTIGDGHGYWSKIHMDKDGCWYCGGKVPERMMFIYKILSMGQEPTGPADVVC